MTQRLAEHTRDREWGDRVAFLIDDDTWTFTQVFDGAARAANGYRSAGLHPGDRVLLALPDSIELVWCLLGAWQAGLVAIPVNVQMSQEDLTRDVTTAEPALAVVDPATAGWLHDAGLAPTIEAEPLIGKGPDTQFADGGQRPALGLSPPAPPEPQTVLLPPQQLRAPTRPGRFIRPRNRLPVDVANVFPGRFEHLAVHHARNRTDHGPLAPQGDPAAAVALMRRHEVTNLFAQPSFLARLLLEPDHAETLSRLRLVTCAGEALSARLREQLTPLLGTRLINAYGATEIGGIAIGRPAMYDTPSAVGPPFDNRPVRIVDPDGHPLPTGQRGELHIRVPFATCGVTRGSLGPRQLTDTWWPTGDLASLDENSVIHVHGRLDDIEVIGGQNVVPGEIERLLESHPRVLEAAVSAVRRPAGHTTLRAYLVSTPPPNQTRRQARTTWPPNSSTSPDPDCPGTKSPTTSYG
ncbi:class I adenylate-forming enzyme family protein [Streptomyces sp. M19]